jgi:hypothetical protein
MGMRVLYTAALTVLGFAYLFAMIHVFATHGGRDGSPPGLSVTDLVIAYSGSQNDTRLEAALKGPMSHMLPTNERAEILAWVRAGAGREEYDKHISKIVETRCYQCHGGQNPHIPNLRGFENISKKIDLDTGMELFTLVKVSHIHLFGITFIFFLVGIIFCHAYVRPLWLKCTIIALPFACLLLDMAGWYLTKLYPGFAWVVMISGIFMGLAFATAVFISLYQIWFYKLPSDISESGGHVS